MPTSIPITPSPADQQVRTCPPLRVAHLLDGRHFGGAEQMVRRLMQGSPGVGVEAWAYCLSEGKLADFLRAEGLRVRVFGATGKYDFSILPRLARQARADRLDLLQAHTSRTHLFARLLSIRLRIPNVTTIQSPIAQDENQSTQRHPLRAWVERLGRPWTTAIVPVSAEEGRRLIVEEHVPPGKLCWIPNGLNPIPPYDREGARNELVAWLRQRGIAAEGPIVAMIAQMRPRKGPEVLLRAFARLRAEGGHGALLLIGNDEFVAGGGYLDRLQALARELEIADSTGFTGFMTEPWTLARGADVLALPSLFGEGLPLVLIEAMNHAIPFAVSDTLGNRELVDGGRHGWAHPPGDAAALARDLAEAAANPTAAQAKGVAGHETFMRQYTLDRVLMQYRDLFDRLIFNCANPETTFGR